MLTCPACGNANPDGSRFCNHCGARLQPAATASGLRPYTPRHLVEQVLNTRDAQIGERKRVTVLFADIKGSTRLAEEAGAEAWHEILDRYFGLLAAAVHRYEGTVNQYTGDGIMALFGAPIAHEDHAQRACLAALEMQREVRAYADELRLSAALNLTMRIGLNTGEVVVGSIGDDLRMDYTAQGHTVNLAARMEHICEPGRIYCSRTTAALVEGYFRLRDLGETAVEGASAPVRVFELEGAGPIQSRLQRALARGAARFIGRESELHVLQRALERACAGAPGIVAVVGAAGVGKSRLCHEFALSCTRQGVTVHRAAGVPYASALPLHPLLTLLRSRFGIGPETNAADTRRLVAGSLLLFDPQAAAQLPRVLDFLGMGDGTARAPEASGDRAELQRFLARFLVNAETPQLLLIEDLHFADAGSEEMIAELCRAIGATRTLLLLNFRPEYDDAWLRDCEHERLPLGALTRRQIETLAAELLGADASVVPLAEELGHRADGNPFFVEEAVLALAESGHLRGVSGAYRLQRAVDEWPIPDTVHALLAARIDRLAGDHKALLQTAAVIGQSFELEPLAGLAGIGTEDCRAALAVLADKGFVTPTDGGDRRYRFSHPLMQDVAYRTQLERTRSAIHRRLAQQLEDEHPLTAPPGEIAVVIAHHWRHAGAWERAARWNLLAAQWRTTIDPTTTLKQFRLALQHVDRAPRAPSVDHLRVMALAGLVRLAPMTDISAEEADNAYREGRALAEANGDTAALAEMLICWAGEQLHRGDAAAARQVAEDFVSKVVAAQMPDLARRYRLSLLLVYTSAGAPREGIAVASALGGEEWLTKAVDAENYMSRGFYGMMLAWMGRLAEGRAHLDAALAVGEREQRATSWMYAFRVDIAWMSGDHAGVLPQAQQALLRAEASGSTYFRALGLRALGFAYVLQGDAAAAVPLLERVRPLLAKGQNAHQFEAHSLAILARAYAGAGRLDEAFATARAAIDSGQRSQSRVWEISAWLALFEIPGEGPWTAMVETGLQRVEALIALTGAASAEPWCWEARARHARTPDERSLCLARAIEGFRGIGALAHVQRLAGATADMPSSAAAPSMSSSGTLAGTLAGTPAERLAAASSTPQRG